MLTVKDFNRITFLHHRGIVPPAPAKEGEHVVEKRYVCSANMKLIEYGYTMSYDLFMAFCNATHAAFLEAWSALYDLVMEDTKAISKASPIWPNFPDDAMEADLVDLYIVNLLNYLTLGQWQPDFDPSKFCKALDREHLPAAKQIPACDEEEIYRYGKRTPIVVDALLDSLKTVAPMPAAMPTQSGISVGLTEMDVRRIVQETMESVLDSHNLTVATPSQPMQPVQAPSTVETIQYPAPPAQGQNFIVPPPPAYRQAQSAPAASHTAEVPTTPDNEQMNQLLSMADAFF